MIKEESQPPQPPFIAQWCRGEDFQVYSRK